MRVGNDVVDLRAADNAPQAIHPRFDERVFTASERELLRACPTEGARHALRWTLWAAKESSLKLLRKRSPELPFRPSEFEVHPGEGSGSATVVRGSTTVHVRLDRDPDRVHAVATERPDEAVATGTECIGPGRSPAFASARVRENAAVEAGRMLGAEAPGGPPPDVTTSAKIPRCDAAVDISLSHDGSWLAHALVRTRPASA